MEEVPFGGTDYWILLGLLVFGRGMDFLSTWIATPGLLLEANPIARRLGWRMGAAVNLLVCGLCAQWPLPALIVTTTSLLVAARNFQSAWLMRTMGEERYRMWFVNQVYDTPLPLYIGCVLAQAVLTALIGASLMYFSGNWLVPLGVGMGMITYAVAVAFYTLLALWRSRRSS
jgi:hypothetical protein